MLLVAACAMMVMTAGCREREKPGSLAVYGKVWTGDARQPVVQALVARGDTILAIGDSADVAPLVGPATTVLHAGDGLVTPGFIDGHTHFVSGGFRLAGINLRDAKTREEFIDGIARFAQEHPGGEWILGGGWDHELWPGAPLPERQWIDSVTPATPLFVRRLDGHMGLANSAALRAAGITKATKDVPGGVIVRDARGEPTGVLKDAAMGLLFKAIPAPTPAQEDAALQRALDYYASRGVTGTSAVSVEWPELQALQRAHARGLLTVRTSVYAPLGEWRRMAELVATNGPGDEVLRAAGVKGYVDGSLGSRTALFSEPYLDDPRTKGLFVTPPDSLRRWVGGADSAGLQVTVHAIGELANTFILDLYDSVGTAHGPRDRRFRVEHAQHLLASDIPRFAALGVIPSMQPSHVTDDGSWTYKRLRPAQIARTYAFRSLLDAKARLVFGSDWTVAPLDPLLGIAAAVTRVTRDGKFPGGWVPEQRISVEEALRAYTSASAYAMFAERSLGLLRPGFRADLVVIDRDLLTVPPEQLVSAQVVTTVMGGKVVYQRPLP